jgi:hypothetical protein
LNKIDPRSIDARVCGCLFFHYPTNTVFQPFLGVETYRSYEARTRQSADRYFTSRVQRGSG